jgi:ABC-type Mn2+/Zn2+ transport system permease subunit
MFDLAEFLKQAMPSAILLVPIIMALVTGLGESFPVIKGQYQFFAALATGLLVGTPIFYVMTEPVSFGEWVAVILFGLICGLTASGKYNSARSAAEKGAEIAADKEVAAWAAPYMDITEADEPK